MQSQWISAGQQWLAGTATLFSSSGRRLRSHVIRKQLSGKNTPNNVNMFHARVEQYWIFITDRSNNLEAEVVSRLNTWFLALKTILLWYKLLNKYSSTLNLFKRSLIALPGKTLQLVWLGWINAEAFTGSKTSEYWMYF